MEKSTEKLPEHPNYRSRKEKGAVVGYGGRVAFLNVGDVFTDFKGRKYRVAEDGSLRRIKGKDEK